MHTVKVSLLIVQVPIQTERLNPRGTNPARKSLSLCVPSRPVPSRVSYVRIRILLPSARVRVHTRTLIQRDRDAISHSNAGQEASASLVHPPGSVPLPPFHPLSLSPLTLRSCALVRSRGPEKRGATKIIKSASFRSVCTSRIWP